MSADERGIKGVVSYVAIHNYAAHRHSAKFGSVQRVGTAGYFERTQRVAPFRSPGARDVGFQFLGIGRDRECHIPIEQCHFPIVSQIRRPARHGAGLITDQSPAQLSGAFGARETSRVVSAEDAS